MSQCDYSLATRLTLLLNERILLSELLKRLTLVKGLKIFLSTSFVNDVFCLLIL